MFVTFEGPEGGGKSTALRAVASRLRANGITVTETREPGAGDFGREVRAVLLEGSAMGARAELFLFLADRAEHVEKIVRPALRRGEIVLCDRHADSTYVYQAVARGLDPDFVRRANAFATDGLVPDLTLLLDIDPEVGLARIAQKDRLDRQPLEFHRAVRAGFLALAASEPVRFVTLDAAGPPEATAERAYRAVFERLVLRERLD